MAIRWSPRDTRITVHGEVVPSTPNSHSASGLGCWRSPRVLFFHSCQDPDSFSGFASLHSTTTYPSQNQSDCSLCFEVVRLPSSDWKHQELSIRHGITEIATSHRNMELDAGHRCAPMIRNSKQLSEKINDEHVSLSMELFWNVLEGIRRQRLQKFSLFTIVRRDM